MSRSPYYPRKRARIQSRKQKPTAQDIGESGSRSIGACAVCDSDLPIIESDGLYYVQAPFGFFCKAAEAQVCPWKFYLEVGTPS